MTETPAGPSLAERAAELLQQGWRSAEIARALGIDQRTLAELLEDAEQTKPTGKKPQ